MSGFSVSRNAVYMKRDAGESRIFAKPDARAPDTILIQIEYHRDDGRKFFQAIKLPPHGARAAARAIEDAADAAARGAAEGDGS